ncbi:major facilitator superfamily domain-containing protein [Phascolomyces articulosus]|uniref:Major facilitator superfamily domain-containing protein n=1 Tax=Phascolomyces articulosus TaxID=60185 RepID=A0AAD5KAW6_9FUNG|nr:major facilitator superfamily domain-containing protein [Phascolomyces articulosus]
MSNAQNDDTQSSSIHEKDTSKNTTIDGKDEKDEGKIPRNNGNGDDVEFIHHKQDEYTEQFDDNDETKDYSTVKKCVIFTIVTSLPAITQLASTALFPTFPYIRDGLNTTETVTNAIAASHSLITGFVPVLWASYSNIYGRRPIYLISSLIMIVGHMGCALSVNIETMIVFRTIAGIGGGVGRTVSVGTISEIFNDSSKGKALALNSAIPISATALGPIIGGILNQFFGWRSLFWSMSICFGILLVLIIFLLPETNKKVIKAKKQRYLQKKLVLTLDDNQKDNNNNLDSPKQKFLLINPVSSLKLLKYPNILTCSIYIGIITFVGYAFTISFAWAYSQIYHFDSIHVGLCFLPGAIGTIISAFIAGSISDKRYKKYVEKAKKSHSEIYPEMRLSKSLLLPAALVMSGASITYGWCIEKQFHFAVGLLAQMFGQFSTLLWICILIIYAVQCTPEEGTSIQACFEMMRSIFTFISILTVIGLENLTGRGVLYTTYGFILFFGSFCVIYIQKNRARWKLMREKKTKDVQQHS